MGMKAAILTDVADTGASTTQDFTIPGFGTPIGYMMWATLALTDGTEIVHYSESEGMCDSAGNMFSFWSKGEDAVATSDCDRRQDTTAVLRMYDPVAETLIAEAHHDSYITDGIRIDYDTVPLGAYQIRVLLLGGPDLKVEVGEHDFDRQSDGDTAAVVLAQAFQPDMVVFMGAHTTVSTYQSRVRRNLGACTPTADACVATFERGGSATAENVISNWETYSCLRYGNAGGTFQHALNLTSMNSDGFTMNKEFVNGDGSMVMGYMALQSDTNEMYVQNVEAPTSTGIQATVLPGTEMKPQCVIIASSACPDVDTEYLTASTTNLGYGISGFDDQRQGATSHRNVDEADPMEVNSRYDDAAVFCSDSAGTTLHDATFHSFQPGQFKLNYTTANATGRRWVVIAFESNERNNVISGPG